VSPANSEVAMAAFDSGVTYDSGARYDELTPTKRKRMKAKSSLNVSSLNSAEIAQLTTNILTAMTGNAHFPTPAPALAEVQTGLTILTTKINTSEVAADAARTALAEREAATQDVRELLNPLAAYVDLISDGAEAIILSAGMPLRPERAPLLVGQVQNLRLTASDENGEINAGWNRVKGTRINRVQISRDAGTPPTNWEEKLTTTKSKCKLNHDLVSGTKVWVRVKAIGANNEGPWSDVAWKTVP